MPRAVRPPLPITGYSLLCALGASRDECMASLRAGRTGLKPPQQDLPFRTAVGALTVDPPALDPPLAAWDTRLARLIALLLQPLEESLRRARERWRAERIGVLLGTSTAGAETTERAYREFVQTGVFPRGYDFARQHTFGAALHVIRALSGAAGPSWTVSTACSSGSKPLATAQRLVATGVLDAVVVGGVDTLCDMTIRGFEALQALDRGPCRPFNVDRAGISIGEGGALAVVDRGGEARVLVESVGESSDAYHISAPHPEGRGALAAMTQALELAGVTPDAVDHVNAHGTGTRLNDSAESKSIVQVFGRDVPVVSTKGFTGHTLGAAGAIEFAIAAIALEAGWIPPSLGVDPKDPAIEVHVPTAVTTGSFRRVMSNSFAFGGNNVSVLLRAP